MTVVSSLTRSTECIEVVIVMSIAKFSRRVAVVFLMFPSAGLCDAGAPKDARVQIQRSREVASNSDNSFRNPEELILGDFHLLRVQKVRTLLVGAGAGGLPQEVEMLTYNGRLVGPTLRVRRGTRLRI